MNDSDVRKLVKEEVKRQINIILSGQTGNATNEAEDIQNLFPGMPGILQRPVMHPYGYCSKAPGGTISVVAKQGDHIGNRLVLGHRAADRPADLAEGESVIYSVKDYRVKVTNTALLISKGEDYEPLVVGETLRQFLIFLLQYIMEHTHLGNLGIETSAPLNDAQFQDILDQYLDNKKILAEDGGRY